MPKLEDLRDLPKKIATRGEYLRGNGYLVKIRTTYTRFRKVRATNPEDAKTFALAREAEFAPNYFKNQNHAGFEVEDISVVTVEEAPREDGLVEED